jgi:hypothetical protein
MQPHPIAYRLAEGPEDLGFIDSIDRRDPHGGVVEWCTRREGHAASLDPARHGALAAT